MENKEKQMPEKQISVSIGQNTYSIKFPNNGQLIDMERMKIQLTDGTHKTMMHGSSSSSVQAYLLVDAIATFTVLIPELKTDLNVNSLLDIDPYQSKKIVKEYVDKFYPWFSDWMKLINEKVD